MRRDELRALGDLAGDAAAGIAGQARQVHESIAARVFAALGPTAVPVREVHDRIAAGAYIAASAVTGGLVRSGAAAGSLARPADAPSLSDALRGRLVVGAINGMWGDRLHRGHSALETPMAVRVRGREVALDAASLRSAFPDATPRLAVFIHGLCETEDAWRLGAARHVPYGDRLRAELGYTPVYVRYNSGRHISHNGRALAALLDALSAAWPVDLAEFALIGHSMGGLVARGACHYAEGRESWRERVRHVFTLGSPHKGAPLELGANAVCHAAARIPELGPFATPIRVRSVGVKDLAYGYVVDADWEGHDPDAFWTNTGTVVPFLTTATHYFVSASLTRDPAAPVGRLLGDLLVLRPSAWSTGRGERLQFPVDQYAHVGGATHFDLLNHPAVYGQIRKWLGTAQLPAPAVRVAAELSEA